MVYAYPAVRLCRAEGWQSSQCRRGLRKAATRCFKALPIIGDVAAIVDCFIRHRGNRALVTLCIIGALSGIDGLEKLKDPVIPT